MVLQSGANQKDWLFFVACFYHVEGKNPGNKAESVYSYQKERKDYE
jgi:hypothetical protein